MPRDGSGNYTLPAVVDTIEPQTTILSDQVLDPLNDIAAALTDSVPINGSRKMTDDLEFEAGKTVVLNVNGTGNQAVRGSQLGAAAGLGVGTTAGTVAAGDDPRFTARDYINLDDYIGFTTGTGDPATAPTVTTEWQAAVTAAIAANKVLRIRGYSSGRRYIKIAPQTFSSELRIETDGAFGIRSTSDTAQGFLFRRRPVMRGDLMWDGGRTSDTLLNGYYAGHNGVVVQHETYQTQIDEPVFEGTRFENWGDSGLTTYFANDLILEIFAKRCGQAGNINFSVYGGRTRGGKISNIFPGATIGGFWAVSTSYTVGTYVVDPLTGQNYLCAASHTSGTGTMAADIAAFPTRWTLRYDRNAVGQSLSNLNGSGERFSEGHSCDGLTVENVLPWTGIDRHTSRRCNVTNSLVRYCGQGIAYENHVAGAEMADILIAGNTVIGYGASSTKDGFTSYSQFGIGANASGAVSTKGLIIANNLTIDCGEGRPGIDGGAGLAVRFARDVKLIGNTMRNSLQRGLVLNGGAAGTDDIGHAQIIGNLVDGVVLHAGVQRGYDIGQYVQGFAKSNTANGLGSSANSYNKAAGGYNFNFGTISTYGVAGDNFWN